jgi:hypothetical protein
MFTECLFAKYQLRVTATLRKCIDIIRYKKNTHRTYSLYQKACTLASNSRLHSAQMDFQILTSQILRTLQSLFHLLYLNEG